MAFKKMKIVPLTKGFICLVDDCDFDRISEHSWSLMDSSRSFYAVTSIANKTVYMHRFILNSPQGAKVDHVNGTHAENVLDNQRQNLRHASDSLNNRNRTSTIRKTASGGLIGVCFDKQKGKWLARARVFGKQTTLGSFSDKYEAFGMLEDWKSKTAYRDSEIPNLKGVKPNE